MNKRYVGPALRTDWESLGDDGQALAAALHDFDCDCASYVDGEYTEVALKVRSFLAGQLSYEGDEEDELEERDDPDDEGDEILTAGERALPFVADWASLSDKERTLAQALHDFDCGCDSYADGKCDRGEYAWLTRQVLELLGWSEHAKRGRSDRD
jgi:hypothetical protein